MKYDAMKFAKRKWNEPKNSVSMVPTCPESTLQAFANEYLELRKVDYFRIEDSFFGWVKMKAPTGVQKWFCWMFGGRPDNTCSIPIGKYSLTLPLELKTEDKKGRKVGRLHGKQKTNSRRENWTIARSPEAIKKEIDNFIDDAEKLKTIIEKHGSISGVYKKC